MKHTIYRVQILATLALLLSFVLFSCDIKRKPYSAMDSEEVTDDPQSSMDYLLNGAYAQMKNWSDVMHRCGEYAGDNIMIRGTSTDAFYEFISFSRTPNNSRLQGFWDSSYKVIAQTSNIIKMVTEGNSSEVDQKLGECYFLRGMMYFYLVRAYGRPYFQNPETNLGVPIVNGTQEDVFGKLPDRATVADTYKQVIADLEKSIQLMKDNPNPSPAYASKEAAMALLSRVYLYMSGTYEHPNTNYAQLAIMNAEAVIDSGKFALLDRESFMKYNRMSPENNDESIFVVKRIASEFSGQAHYYGIGGMYANIGGMGWGEMYASAKYLELLDETGRNDWAKGKIVDARATFIEPQYIGLEEKDEVFRFVADQVNSAGNKTGYKYLQLAADRSKGPNVYVETGGTADAPIRHEFTLIEVKPDEGVYAIDYSDGKRYIGVKDYRIKLNRAFPMFYITKCSREGEESHLHSPVIIRLGEVYLNAAEAYAKVGNYSKALHYLNAIRERSLPGEGYTMLNASNAGELIDKERQLELAFQAERSYDVFRNGKSLSRHYPGPHDALQDIPSTDYRVVYYIPQPAINAYLSSGSVLTQNPTSN